MPKFFDFINKHRDLFTIFGLLILCYFVFFFNIGNYALMDVDETRYVSMARDMFHSRDFLTLYLNGEYFFEKPPLYFWGECYILTNGYLYLFFDKHYKIGSHKFKFCFNLKSFTKADIEKLAYYTKQYMFLEISDVYRVD